MRIPRTFFLLAVFLAAFTTADDDSGATTTENATEFIRTSCEATQYPEMCYQSLSGYATTVQQDPARLAGAAVSVSLSSAAFMSIYLANLTRQTDYGADPRCGSALRDCFSLFRDAVSQIRGSLKQMQQLTGDGGEELRFQMSNVQTWMSAALTNEDTCTDGFDQVRAGPVKMDVCDRTVKVKEVTSNALALVNSYVAKVTVP
ncbi:hypothetical protein ACS0TY_008481 [Phlomoides rotata]